MKENGVNFIEKKKSNYGVNTFHDACGNSLLGIGNEKILI